jgi:phosphoglucosamine mutase
MNRELFGTDGVRGLAGLFPLDKEGAVRIGRAVGAHFAEAGQRVVLGRDPRESSDELAAHIVQGLNEVGVNVTLAGVLPTPGISYLTREHDKFVAGVMITASHNPYQYNGVKVFDAKGDKLSDQTESTLNNLIDSGVPDRNKGSFESDDELVNQYENFLASSAGDVKLNMLSIAIDSANGAASGIAGRLFERLGAQVTPMFDQPDGININDGCGATNIQKMSDEVVGKKLSLGIAVDGDADRIIMVDELGREVKGDYILYILAVANNWDGVVATVMSNIGFESSLHAKGIKLLRTQVGDRYVLEGLAKTGYKLGGEQSGHIILPDLLKTGDALLAAVQTVCAVMASGKSLAQWCDEVELLPQSLVNITVESKDILKSDEVKQFLEAKTAEIAKTGRLFVRASGTEPLVRVMVEAPNAETLANTIAAKLEELIKQKAKV